jgi:hypothetical protein
MKFKSYKIIPNIITGKIALNLAILKDIKKCEYELSINFDSEYIEYVTKFGEGILGGSYIRIYTPKRILTEVNEWRTRINEYWFWDKGKEFLTKEQALTSILIGDTIIGDNIVYYKREYYILPRDFEDIYKLGFSLYDTIEWLCTNGLLFESFSERNFEPFSE